MSVKILYFAWVREKIGKAEEIVDLPAGVGTVADLVAWLKQRGPEYAEAFARAERGPRRHRPDARPAHRQHRRRARDRLLPAGDGRLSVSVRVQTRGLRRRRRGARASPPGRTDIGAIVTFTGTVRAENDGRRDHRHDARALSRHDGERSWRASRPKPAQRWPLQASLIVHRVGTLKPGDNIVLVVTASAHREAAFAAAEFLMDYLKTRAPFWKKERGADGTGALGRRPRQRRARSGTVGER